MLDYLCTTLSTGSPLTSIVFRSPQFYQVNIVAGDADDEIVIEGLYNEVNSKVVALVTGTQISIPNQNSAGVTYVGSGTANADYSQIALSFTANDGSGPDQIEAVLVP